ncbi:riboflavin-binding protein-like [Huso huso]|uniref:Riboflavin-binding protein-like n=1 Tax=Huso huso TaxID=61971 RepID=A0ABR0ZHX7_HUSHU
MMKLAAGCLFVLFSIVSCHKDKCLDGKDHRKYPSADPNMKECTIYSNCDLNPVPQRPCCYGNFTEQLVSPVLIVDNTHWDRCGKLSEKCEVFMKKIECFYQCSPHAAHWINPNYTVGILLAPLCLNFCDNWFEACKDDLTCARNWLTDFDWNYDGNHCRNSCVPYSQMYKNGRDLCQSMWGQSFTVSESPCRCLRLDGRDEVVMKYLLPDKDTDSSEEVHSDERSCQLEGLGEVAGEEKAGDKSVVLKQE